MSIGGRTWGHPCQSRRSVGRIWALQGRAQLECIRYSVVPAPAGFDRETNAQVQAQCGGSGRGLDLASRPKPTPENQNVVQIRAMSLPSGTTIIPINFGTARDDPKFDVLYGPSPRDTLQYSPPTAPKTRGTSDPRPQPEAKSQPNMTTTTKTSPESRRRETGLLAPSWTTLAPGSPQNSPFLETQSISNSRKMP